MWDDVCKLRVWDGIRSLLVLLYLQSSCTFSEASSRKGFWSYLSKELFLSFQTVQLALPP